MVETVCGRAGCKGVVDRCEQERGKGRQREVVVGNFQDAGRTESEALRGAVSRYKGRMEPHRVPMSIELAVCSFFLRINNTVYFEVSTQSPSIACHPYQIPHLSSASYYGYSLILESVSMPT